MAEDNRKTEITRRGFLKFLAAIPAGYLLYRYLVLPVGKTGAIIRRNINDIPEGGALIFPDENVALIRESGEPVALSLACTHLGCTVKIKDSGFTCPCHGSKFELNGALVTGPAERALDRYRVSVDNGVIEVYEEKVNV